MAEGAPEPGDEPTVVDLQNRLAELEAANAELTARLDAEAAADAEETVALTRTRPPRWRGAVASLLIVLAALLTPVAIVSGWARVLLSDTDSFVATYAPLVQNPRVQAYLTDQIADAIDARIDIDATVNEVFDGLGENIQRPTVKLALDALRQPAADGVRSTIRNVAAKVVSSDAFAQVWRESLRLSHSQAISALNGDTSSVTITEEGLGLRLAPLIAKVKEALVEQGFALASRIPEIDRTVVLVHSDSLLQVQLGYRAALATGYWLGVVVLVLFVAGVLVSVRKWLATIWAAIGLGLGAALVLGGVGIGRVIAQASVPLSVMPNDVLLIFFDTVTGAINDLATATLILAIAVAVVAWLAAPFRVSGAVRGAWDGLSGGLRTRGDAHGLSTGKVGEWLYAQRALLRFAVGLVAALVLVFNRPLSAGLVIGTAVVAAVVLLLLSLLERPAQTPAAAAATGSGTT